MGLETTAAFLVFGLALIVLGLTLLTLALRLSYYIKTLRQVSANLAETTQRLQVLEEKYRKHLIGHVV